MTKKLFYLLFPLFLNAQINLPTETKQLLLVNANDMNSSIATLQAYEKINTIWIKKFKPIKVNLGRNGLGWENNSLKK